MLRELNETEMEMVSGGTEVDEIVVTARRRTGDWVSVHPDQWQRAGLSAAEYFYGADYNISPELLEAIGDLVLPEGVSIGTITLPDPDPTIDPNDPTASQTTTFNGLTIDLGGGVSVTVGGNSAGTIGGNITVEIP